MTYEPKHRRPDLGLLFDVHPHSELCLSGQHAQCRHPSNRWRTDGCACRCHRTAEAAA